MQAKKVQMDCIKTGLWQSLEKRLKGLSDYKRNGNNAGLFRIEITTYVSLDQRLVGWDTPKKIPYEPKTFPAHFLDYDKVGDWQDLLSRLSQQSGRTTRAILIQDGKPIGILVNQPLVKLLT